MCPGKTYADLVTPGGIESRLGGNSGGPGFYNLGAVCAPPVIGDPEVATIIPLGLKAGVPAATTYGNSGVGILRGPGQANFDFSVLKSTRITERQSVQFRAEFFNVFNHPQFSPPSYNSVGRYYLPDVNSPTGGWITSTSVNPRIIQLALKYSF
jgi:hypothetical protein